MELGMAAKERKEPKTIRWSSFVFFALFGG